MPIQMNISKEIWMYYNDLFFGETGTNTQTSDNHKNDLRIQAT